MNIQAIEERSELLCRMRSWFADNDYLEVSTPILSTHLIPEPTIANFATQYISEFHGSRELYLVPSPEVHMKRIIAETKRSIYQFSHCFRNREQIGSHHNPEFTML
ncbi:MAG TPA: elongation factor P--(R)-beta-lysine ligase, partial [Sphaerochaeta sp.]|nr:elongation factor P--(R)-beta-lysine ligase [Sphaerochaeta sp.]